MLLDLHWDGKAVTGHHQPGPDAVPLKTAVSRPHELDGPFRGGRQGGSAGSTVRYVIEGKLENLGSYYRVITGTWSQGTQKGDFRITRN